ncbi:mitochondrial thiamine pyrophosphate transporter [Knufia obscura]|uniref:Mitochondrial thiamine pyrophosphate carrier 1 n=2 Tax=Knufia TaxID=430999 RepID=A0AAN8IB15_9EURO|nr:mitochondrial thiamine pyrophosphate transporter [Knufia obscura]KAK5957516.1 mitochondrial thiamine pyrophosphate transporter [Knufia fluminis]
MSRIERLKDEGSRSQVIISGAVAGLISRFCIAPLDVVKIRLQLQTHSLSDPLTSNGIKGPTYKGVWGTLRKIQQQEGTTALWKGNIPAELLYICYGGSQFVAYRTVSQLLSTLPKRLPPSAESFVSGATAGAAATTVTYPLDLLRTRFAAQGTEKVYEGIIASLRDISRNEGVRGFFRGCAAANGQIIPYMGLFFSSYEMFHQALGGTTLPFSGGDAIAGVLASVLSKSAVFPLDLVRKRLQVQGPTRSRYIHTNIPEYRGVIRSLIQINRREGFRGMYRGLTVSLMKTAPASAITMYVYERTLHLMMHNNHVEEA